MCACVCECVCVCVRACVRVYKRKGACKYIASLSKLPAKEGGFGGRKVE